MANYVEIRIEQTGDRLKAQGREKRRDYRRTGFEGEGAPRSWSTSFEERFRLRTDALDGEGASCFWQDLRTAALEVSPRETLFTG